MQENLAAEVQEAKEKKKRGWQLGQWTELINAPSPNWLMTLV
jgi:hypothetical protein